MFSKRHVPYFPVVSINLRKSLLERAINRLHHTLCQSAYFLLSKFNFRYQKLMPGSLLRDICWSITTIFKKNIYLLFTVYQPIVAYIKPKDILEYKSEYFLLEKQYFFYYLTHNWGRMWLYSFP